MYSCISLSLYLRISVLQYFSIAAFQYLSIEAACFRYRNMYTCIPTALFNTYLHIPVFPFSGITAFPHSSISSLPYFHIIGHPRETGDMVLSIHAEQSFTRDYLCIDGKTTRGIPPAACLALFALPWSGKGMRIDKRHARQISYSPQATGNFISTSGHVHRCDRNNTPLQ